MNGKVGALVASGIGAVLLFDVSWGSCAKSPPGATPPPYAAFVGELVAERGFHGIGTLFEFEVESVEQGELGSDRAVVSIVVDRTVRLPNGDTLRRTSSVSVGDAPVAGRRYWVSGPQRDVDGERRIFISDCGGSLSPLPPEHLVAAGPRVTPEGELRWDADRIGLGITAAAALTLACALLFSRARSGAKLSHGR